LAAAPEAAAVVIVVVAALSVVLRLALAVVCAWKGKGFD
jgi:hypothetical protein